MSHFTKITAEIKDLDALKAAAANMNLKLESNTGCRYYYGIERKEHVVKLPGKYDVSIEANSDGSYDINADFYGGHVEEYIGPNGSELLRQYSIEKLKIEAKKHGYKVYDAGNGALKLIDKISGGKAIVSVCPDGKINVETSGFKGQSCMNFSIIEKALGKIDDVKKKPEYYQANASEVHLKEWS